MARMFQYDGAAVAAALNRIKDGVDHGSVVQRPRFDPRERAERVKMTADGRTPEAFQRVMEAHGFRFYPAKLVEGAAYAVGMEHRVALGELGPEVEGQWRNPRLCGGAAFTPNDLLANFLTPEDFDGWVRKEKLKAKLARRGVAKAESRLALSRS